MKIMYNIIFIAGVINQSALGTCKSTQMGKQTKIPVCGSLSLFVKSITFCVFISF